MNHDPSIPEFLRDGLDRSAECPAPAVLEQLLDAPSGDARVAAHVESCTYCATEVRLLREFQAAGTDPAEAAQVRAITQRLSARSGEIFTAGHGEAWWRRWFTVPRLTPMLAACAGLLVIFAIGIQMRQGAPALRPPTQSEVLRSNAVVLTGPSGDITAVPERIEWQPVALAASYEVRLLQVDGAELWKGTSPVAVLQLPAAARAQIVPSKTLMLQVSALDASGRKIAESEPTRFRLLPNLYKR